MVAYRRRLTEGAAAQAVQCANSCLGYAETQSLILGCNDESINYQLGGVLLDSEEALERLFTQWCIIVSHISVRW